MKSRDARFKGTGNFYSEARRPGWKLQCSTCDAVKIVLMPHGILPPDAIIKKFIQAGWYVGKRPEDDQCIACCAKRKEHKEREPNIDDAINNALVMATRKCEPASNESTDKILMKERDREHFQRVAIKGDLRPVVVADDAAAALSRERSFICGIHALLVDGLIDNAIDRIESHLPSWPLRKRPKGVADPKYVERKRLEKIESDYTQWVEDQQKKYQGESK